MAEYHLVVRDVFGLGGKMYDVGQHIADAAEIEAVEKDRAQFVRRIAATDPAEEG